MESFFHTLKTELVMHCDYKTRDDARVSLFDYMEVFYNRQRRHSSISYEARYRSRRRNRRIRCPPFVGKTICGRLRAPAIDSFQPFVPPKSGRSVTELNDTDRALNDGKVTVLLRAYWMHHAAIT